MPFCLHVYETVVLRDGAIRECLEDYFLLDDHDEEDMENGVIASQKQLKPQPR